MTNNVKEVHLLLNKIYRTAEQDYQKLIKLNYNCELINCSNNYIYYDEDYHKQRYPIPVIVVKNFGDIGYNLDKYFFEFSFKNGKFFDFKFDCILDNYKDIEIYGGRNCFIDFYEEGETAEEVINKIELSDEENIMLSLYFDHNQENLVKEFLEVTKILEI